MISGVSASPGDEAYRQRQGDHGKKMFGKEQMVRTVEPGPVVIRPDVIEVGAGGNEGRRSWG